MNNLDNYKLSIQYLQNVTIENFDKRKLISYKSNFITENSRDIPDDIIIYATKNIDRATYVVKLAKLLNDMTMAIEIEASIFEFSLIHATLNNIDKQLVCAIYDDKYSDIFLNLDETSRLKNKTLRTSVLERLISPRLVAFLSPDQTHPEIWASILDKIKLREDRENNMAVTDLYRCAKCKERKSKVTELQMRGADEPTNIIVTCLVCYHTFIK